MLRVTLFVLSLSLSIYLSLLKKAYHRFTRLQSYSEASSSSDNMPPSGADTAAAARSIMSRLIEFAKRASHSQCGANAAEQSGTLLYGLGVSQVMVVYVPLVDNHDEDEMAAKFFMACECDCYGFGGGARQPKHPDRRPLANKGTPEYEANGNVDKSGKKANL